MTDRDLFSAGPGKLDEHPDSSPLPSQDGVSLGCREQFSNLPRIAPTLWRRTHALEYCTSDVASGGPPAARGRVCAARRLLSQLVSRGMGKASLPSLPVR
jgi:hypothetical protein